ncbi:MAG: CZB domain-containing protein [Ignavibacteriae bacterium]|nr:CZB domain-containing protein [Ignavibacteriota bacterium]
MVNKDEIEAALGVHAKWKARLETAIIAGRSEFIPAEVAKNDVCDFGKWLRTVGGEDAKTAHYAKVKSFHADFHTMAGKILNMAVTGRKAEAQKALEPGGDYARICGKLVMAMNVWKESTK